MDEPGRVLLFGGTFDPIHHGHLTVSRHVAEQLALPRVVLIPSAAPPHKDAAGLTAAQHRWAMARQAVEGDELFEVSDCELRRPGPSYTLDTVRYFRERYGKATQLYWLIGADTLADLPGWYRINRLAEECTIVTAARPGWSVDDWHGLEEVLDAAQLQKLKDHVVAGPLVDISATEIRRRVREGQSISELVPATVDDYIKRHGLYQAV